MKQLLERTKQTTFPRRVALTAIAGFVLLPSVLKAEDQSELIQRLLNRIERLEKKVEELESAPGNATPSLPPADTNAAAIQELEQKVSIMERNPDFSASSASGWSAGTNCYLNRNVRLNASYSYTPFSGGGGTGIGGGTVAPAIVTRQPEQGFFTRVQLAF